jgi:hypothetical protein
MNPSMRCLCVVLALFFAGTASTSRAQFPDLFEVSATYLPDVVVDVPDADKVRVQVSSYTASLNLPVVLGERTFFIPGLSYRADSVSYHGAPDGFVDLRAFHGIDLSLMLVQLLPRDWSLAIRLAPGLAGDLVTIDADTLRLSAAAFAVHAFGPDLQLGFGVIASYGFGSFLVLPAAYLAIGDDDDRVKFEMMLPAFAKLFARPLGGLELGLRAEVSGSSYAVRDAQIAGRWPCQGEVDASGGTRPSDPARCFDNLAYSVVDVSLFAAVELWDSFWLDASVGRTVYRRFEPKNGDGETLDNGGQDLPNAWSVRVGVTFRLPRE